MWLQKSTPKKPFATYKPRIIESAMINMLFHPRIFWKTTSSSTCFLAIDNNIQENGDYSERFTGLDSGDHQK